MTPEQQQAARARCEAATAGPWSWSMCYEAGRYGRKHWAMVSPYSQERGCVTNHLLVLNTHVAKDCDGTPLEETPDFEFIAHARTDLPAALDALEAAEAEIARLRAVVRELREEVIVGDLAAMEMCSGFLWTKAREAEYRANAEQITRKLTGEESCEST